VIVSFASRNRCTCGSRSTRASGHDNESKKWRRAELPPFLRSPIMAPTRGYSVAHSDLDHLRILLSAYYKRSLVIGDGSKKNVYPSEDDDQGRGRTADLPIFRSPDNSSPNDVNVRDLHPRINPNTDER
jgi:hypothetical protein